MEASRWEPNMREDCVGYFRGKCGILSPADCDGCKFFCTKRGAEARRYRAAEILERKGLTPCIKIQEDGKMIMSTRKV